MNAQTTTKSYGTMLGEHVCGIHHYSADELAIAARHDAGVTPGTPIHVFVPAGPKPSDTNLTEYNYFARLPGVTVMPDGVVSVPVTDGLYGDSILADLARSLADVSEEIDDMLADRPGMRNWSERAFDDLVERQAALEAEINELERVL